MTGHLSDIDFLTKRFPTEESAVAYFAGKRWGEHVSCPYCGSVKVYASSGKQPYKCGDCNTKFTAKTGTIMENSKIPVRIWLLAMHIMGTARKGISSIELAKRLGVSRRQAGIWHIEYVKHVLRRVCFKENIQVDELYAGGLEKNKHASKRLHKGRGAANKIAVVGLREQGGRTIARVVKDTTAETLQGLIAATVQTQSTVYTDGHRSYTGLQRLGYKHELVNHSSGEFVRGHVTTNSIESFWALLRRGLYGTFHSVSTEHLQRYVNEFSFRLSSGDTFSFIDAVCTHANGNMLTYKQLCATRSK